MSEDRMRILNMLADGKVTAAEAERLLDALGAAPRTEIAATPDGAGPKYLRVQVEKGRSDERDPKHVNIRVPLQLLRAGVRLQGILPPKARASLNEALAEQGVDLDIDKLKGGEIETLIAALTQTSIDINAHDGRSRVKISCE
jgi:hypothetical protein